MYKKIVGNQEIYIKYSIYSPCRPFTIRSCQNFKSKNQKDLLSQISAFFKCFLLFSNSLFYNLTFGQLIANISLIQFKYWNLCYFIIDYTMNPRQEQRAYQVVQILKNDIMDDTASSDDHLELLDGSNGNKTKKSLFGSLIKGKNTKKPKVKITKKIETCSTINFEMDSLSSEQELAHCHFSEGSAKCWQKPKAKQIASQAETNKHYNFIQKIIKRSKLKSAFTKQPSVIKTNKNAEDNSSQNNLGDTIILSNTFIPTSYLPKHNIKLINGITELQDLLQNLHQSEEHLLYLLKKYIADPNFQKQLLDSTFEYFALQYDAKCKSNTITNKMWSQQLEMNKIQDYNIQKRLDFLVKSNRHLQLQVEILCRHCEKLAFRTNLYPKRFLHMRSFGKIYARQLIANNRKLQIKIKALTEVISDFEEELQKFQHQKVVTEEEKRSLRLQIYQAESTLEQQNHDHQLEKAEMTLQINRQSNLIQDTITAIQCIFEDLHGFGHQLNEFEITIIWPQFQHRETCLPEMVYQARACIGELFVAAIVAFKNVSQVAKDVNKLRNTNARLQENLQKSTSELDNLSKKLEKTPVEAENNKFLKLQQENFALKLKLENITEQNNYLRNEIEDKKSSVNDTKASVTKILSEKQLVSNKIAEIVIVISEQGCCKISNELHTDQDKLDYVKLSFDQFITDRKKLIEKCNSLEGENKSLVQSQQEYQQELATLQDGLTLLSGENENFKKQLAIQHQTLSTLQNERIRYLEEKNLLKTIFQHLRGEVSRVQQLEGAVADMGRETSRLSLIAEFNKQIGEQLKNEIEMKENTISELKHSLEKLSHIQIDTDKQRMTLSAQLSEISTVKDKLSDCLELELKKNVHLDETKKKLETSTKSQLKIYEEMQKNERAALKELLRDFKNLIKQRDCLLRLQEENKKEYKDLEKVYLDLKKQYQNSLVELQNRDVEIHKLCEKIQQQSEQTKQVEENLRNSTNKYERNLRKLEKILAQVRMEKEETANNVTILKNTIVSMKKELKEANDKLGSVENNLAIKLAECATLESELVAHKNELQNVTQENGKIIVEMEYIKKLNEQQLSDLKETLSNNSVRESKFLEFQTTVWKNEQEINELNRIINEKENIIKQIELEYNCVKKQTEDQNKIMICYENQLVVLQDIEATKVKLEKEFNNKDLELKSAQFELENSKKEIEKLKNELKETIVKTENEKSFYKNQTNDIILEYTEQKENIEEEIDSISEQLRKVTENLQIEKERFDELAKSHEELQQKCIQMKETCTKEVNSHKETRSKIEDLENFMKNLASERDNLQQQVHLILLELNEEKDNNGILSAENKKLQKILDQGRQQYRVLMDQNSTLEDEINELKAKIKNLIDSKNTSQSEINKGMIELAEKNAELNMSRETIECLKKDLNESQKTLVDLKEDFFKIQQQVTGLEFKNCELTLQLHETQAKLEAERNITEGLKALKGSERTPHKAPPSECGELYY